MKTFFFLICNHGEKFDSLHYLNLIINKDLFYRIYNLFVFHRTLLTNVSSSFKMVFYIGHDNNLFTHFLMQCIVGSTARAGPEGQCPVYTSVWDRPRQNTWPRRSNTCSGSRALGTSLCGAVNSYTKKS